MAYNLTRINKYLADLGYSTRRGADELVKSKKVFINGRLAVLGSKVGEGDKVEVLKSQKFSPAFRYFAYYKPRDVVTHSPENGQKEIKNLISLKGVFPVGRLDKSSSGLIILTDDGRLTDRLLNPEREHEKEYEVSTAENLRGSFKKKMEEGVNVGDYKTKKCAVKVLSPNSFRIILTEGKKHQIRRMAAALFLTITKLKRVRIMNIKLANLKEGEWREISGRELDIFLKSVGLN